MAGQGQMHDYFRPLVQSGPVRPEGAVMLAGGPAWFVQTERLNRQARPEIVAAHELPADLLSRLSHARAPLAGLAMDRPRIMGILNVTPDSFSDGGQFDGLDAARARAQQMVAEGADILDIGGESTRPGADVVAAEAEIARTAPVIAALREGGLNAPISIDTRKAPVARAALAAGADLVNDVAAFTYDPELAGIAARADAPVCLMHAQGDPKTMQQAPAYENVLLDVYDFLAARVAAAQAAGIAPERIIVDPGIGFGKTQAHNLALLRGISLFHGLGCAVLLGASRKRFIGVIGAAPEPQARMPGSVAVALEAVRQGVQILRVHDISQTRQALRLTQAIWGSLIDE